MKNAKRMMKLGAFFMETGHHVTSWRHPEAQADAGVNFAHYVEIARTAERAKFDMIFFADSARVRTGHVDAISRSAQYIAHFEPITLLSALATVTERIGLVATASTSYNEPYHIARKFASLDFISNGRAGWNIVTSASRTRRTTSAARRTTSTKSATIARASSPNSCSACGTAGTTTRSFATRRRGCSSIPKSSTS